MYRQRAKENVPLMMVRRAIKVFYHYHLSSHGSGLYTIKWVVILLCLFAGSVQSTVISIHT